MKKVLVTILSVIYFSFSVGATVHLHFCMDKLVEWGVTKDKSGQKSCPFCGMPKSTGDKACVKQQNGCCKDEERTIKIEKDQKLTWNSFDFAKKLLVTNSSPSYEFYSIYKFAAALTLPLSHAPPTADVPLFVRHSNFRI